ncbi:FIG092679: Fe-S oxidoreductase [hydrothermal vent metagenome]|uniref:FIG092679: Fe-S oxidoreductase n=1 Tax=hydrothermal vent metagenome TaxID=652676 RepID=A0A3B1CDA7_9ZZZZ
MTKKRDLSHDPGKIAVSRLEKETGAVVKEPGGRLSVALAYPNQYEIGMSNLGLQKIYHLFNRRDDVSCERVFLPSPKEIEFLKKNKRPLESMETGRALRTFDLLAFSITFEMDYINVLTMLDLAKIPFKDRTFDDPMIVAGGICVTLNPELMAPFLDLAFIGEGEGVVDTFVDALLMSGTFSMSPFGGLPGVYAPSAYSPEYTKEGAIERIEIKSGFPEKIGRVWAKDYKDNPNVTVIETPDTVFGDMILIETGKGCGRHCRFCAAGYAYRPTRFASYETLTEKIDEALADERKIGLVGSNISDHPDMERIFEYIVNKGGKFSVSSMRIDRLTDTTLELMLRGGCKTITVAPEAGTESLRRRINKDISDETIIEAARLIGKTSAFDLKLYFLVGLPGETQKDVEGIVELVESIQGAMVTASKERGTVGKIRVSVNGFVPKPFTPFQWEPYAGIKEVGDKLKIVKSGLKKTPGVTVQTSSARYDYVQTLLSVGDRRVAEVLQLAHKYDGDWFKAIKQTDIDCDFFVTRRKSVNEILPWSFIDHGLRDDYLSHDSERSEKGKVIAECPPPDEKCDRCGQFDCGMSH